MSKIEERIASALANDVPSAQLDALIEDVETAIIEAGDAAEAERERALDLRASRIP